MVFPVKIDITVKVMKKVFDIVDFI